MAIVGRVNVGKSTLFNRLCGGRRALVHKQPGVTRDWLSGRVQWQGRSFDLVDTGGLEGAESDPLAAQVRRISQRVAAEADLVLLVVDGRAGLVPGDQESARWLRHRARRVLLVVNKLDGPGQESAAAEFTALGFDPLYPISAEHGRGLPELLDAILELLAAGNAASQAPPQQSSGLAVAILGPPNAGKSTLVNRILGSERCLVSELPGTTRDAVDVTCEIDGLRLVLIDTAGLRRGRREGLSGLGSLKADAALARAEVAVLLLDAGSGVGGLEASIGGQIESSQAAAVLALNKWDLFEEQERREAAGLDADAPQARTTRSRRLDAESEAERAIRRRLPGLSHAPWLPISARTGSNVARLLKLIEAVARQRARRISTRELNRFIAQLQQRETIGSGRGKALKVFYATQAGTCPPLFRLFTNTARLPPATERYLIGRLRQRFGLIGTPIRLANVLR
ncbi:MAG TPA: ribosome biogenesis GTPase Der [Acidobacteriota bacterium]